MTTAEAAVPAPDPKDRILDAAEQLFAERGVGATSLRAITAAAGMNPAAIHYHYGSKEALLLAVAHRRADPVNARRLEALDRLEAEGGPLEIEAILEAFLRPELVANPAPLSAILHHERRDIVEQVVPRIFGGVHERFAAAIASCLPALDPLELELRFRLVVGVMLHVVRGFHDIPMPAGPAACGRPDEEERLRRVIAFAAAGLRAAGTPPSPEAAL